MKNIRLIRWLYRISSFLLYLEGAFIFLSFVVIPLMITGQTYSSSRRQQVEYDTTLRTGSSSGHGFSMATTDTQGQLISQAERRDSVIIYYGENQRKIYRLRLDSLKRLLQPKKSDNIPVVTHQRAVAYQHKLNRQVDSIQAVDPGTRIVRMPDRWIIQPGWSSGFAWSVTIPLQGEVWPKARYQPQLPQQWQRILAYKPYTYLQQNLDKRLPFVLRASIFRWSDLNSFIWPLLLISSGWGLFYVAMLMLMTHWFREIFADLLNGEFFGKRIAQRVQQSGWLFIGGFVLENAIDVFQPIVAQQYLKKQGYLSYAQWVWSGPDHWLWLWAGLVLLVFAQIFRYGTQLQQENELTI
ncbi:DUF2975 domain-containing protein [uncultured Fibrella sp.]|uniref:DUF2975 domain-containing protein n=1 Tax=uncultured Fibrella sp. TaxID=1284596 RepID=UPI0035CBE1AB